MALSRTGGCSDNSVVLNPMIPTNTYGAHETQGELGDHAGGHRNTLIRVIVKKSCGLSSEPELCKLTLSRKEGRGGRGALRGKRGGWGQLGENRRGKGAEGTLMVLLQFLGKRMGDYSDSTIWFFFCHYCGNNITCSQPHSSGGNMGKIHCKGRSAGSTPLVSP